MTHLWKKLSSKGKIWLFKGFLNVEECKINLYVIFSGASVIHVWWTIKRLWNRKGFPMDVVTLCSVLVLVKFYLNDWYSWAVVFDYERALIIGWIVYIHCELFLWQFSSIQFTLYLLNTTLFLTIFYSLHFTYVCMCWKSISFVLESMKFYFKFFKGKF